MFRGIKRALQIPIILTCRNIIAAVRRVRKLSFKRLNTLSFGRLNQNKQLVTHLQNSFWLIAPHSTRPLSWRHQLHESQNMPITTLYIHYGIRVFRKPWVKSHPLSETLSTVSATPQHNTRYRRQIYFIMKVNKSQVLPKRTTKHWKLYVLHVWLILKVIRRNSTNTSHMCTSRHLQK